VALKSSLVRWVEWRCKYGILRAITEQEWLIQKRIPKWAQELQPPNGKATVFSLPKGTYPKCWELKQYESNHLQSGRSSQDDSEEEEADSIPAEVA